MYEKYSIDAIDQASRNENFISSHLKNETLVRSLSLVNIFSSLDHVTKYLHRNIIGN